MGCYTYFTSTDLSNFSKVSDEEINEMLQEIRSFFPQIYIKEREHIKYGFFKETRRFLYTVYFTSKPDGLDARIVKFYTDHESSLSGLGDRTKPQIMNYLNGIITGYHINQSN